MSKAPIFPLHTPVAVPAVPRARSKTLLPFSGAAAPSTPPAASPPDSVPSVRPRTSTLVPIAFEPVAGARPLRTPVLGTELPAAPPPVVEVRVADYDESCKVKGETLLRTWLTFRLRAHDRRVGSLLRPALLERLQRGDLLPNEWYPIRDYLELFAALKRVGGHEEVVSTAQDSVVRGFKRGSWKVFLPMLADFAPESFCARAVKRYALIWKTSFQPGDVAVTEQASGAELTISGVPWAGDAAFQSALAGDLVSIPFYACLKGAARVDAVGGSTLRCTLTWSK